MKTTIFKLFVTTFTLATVIGTSASSALAQRGKGHDNKEEKKNYQFEKKAHPQTRQKETYDRREATRRDYRYDNHRYDNRRDVRSHPDYRSDRDRYTHRIPEPFVKNRYYHYHPKYGHVVSRFAHSPKIFHSRSGKYYFCDGYFYRHQPGIGYIWVESPRNLVFERIPSGAVQVWINGHAYFRIGNIYLASGPFGYEVVTLPARYYPTPGIHISAHF